MRSLTSTSVLRLVWIASGAMSRRTSEAIAAGTGQEQSVGGAVLRIGSAFQQSVFDQTIKQPHQRDRLQFENFGKIDLRQAFLLAKPKQHDPLRPRRASRFGAVIDIVAQEARTLDKLRDQLAF